MDSQFIEAVCLAAVEILGEKDAFLILKKTGVRSFTSFDSNLFSLEKLGGELAQKYGAQTAMGLMIRIGRASLTFLRRFFPQISALGEIENRLVPLDKRFPNSLKVLAEVTALELGDEVIVDCTGNLSYDWQINARYQSYTPYYHFGLLEEFCYWLDSRKDYQMIYAADAAVVDSRQIHVNIHEKE